MRKLIAVGMLVGGLLAGAVPAMAQQGGIGDPLTLAASGVLIPYITAGGTVALVEVASPVSNNPNLHMQFFDASCSKVGPSVGLPLTTNDIGFQQVSVLQGGTVPANLNGLVAISAVGPDGFTNIPLEAPIHSRVYLFNPNDGTSRVLEPIILDTAEFSGNPHTWSPMRTAATFFSPLVTVGDPTHSFSGGVRTHLFLACPDGLIQGDSGGYFSSSAFPQIAPPFPTHFGTHGLRARIYDTNEVFKRNVFPILCTCFTELDLGETTTSPPTPPFPASPSPFGPDGNGIIDPIYSNAGEVPFGTYTELEEIPPGSSFTGYREVFTEGSSNNHFFGRLSNGNRTSIQGTVTNAR